MNILKNKKKLLILPILIIPLIALYLLINNPVKKHITPVAKLSLATYNTFKSETLKLNTNISFQEISYSYNELSPLSQKQLETITSLLSTATVDIETIYDLKNKKMQFYFTLNIDESRSTSFSAYIDKDMLAISFDEINQEVIYITWDRISGILGIDIEFQEYIDALFAIDLKSLKNSKHLVEIYNLLDDSLTFNIEKNVQTKIAKMKKATEYKLITTLPDLKNLLKEFVNITFTNDDMKDSLSEIFHDFLTLLILDLEDAGVYNNFLTNWMENNDKFIPQLHQTIQSIKKVPEIEFYTIKNHLSKVSFSNVFETNLFDIIFTYQSNLSTTYQSISSDINWLHISSNSIDIGSLDPVSLTTFSKKFSRKLYTLCLKYSELLEFFAPFILN